MFSLRDDANLREFVLENVEHFGEERVLGTGSYGSVQEVSHCMLYTMMFLCTVSSASASYSSVTASMDR